MIATSDEIARELSPREKVLWSGQPRQGIVFRRADAFLIPFSILWCGFAVFWEVNVLNSPNAPVFFMFWGIPFVAVGLYIVAGRFFVEAQRRARTFYAVTGERILIVSGLVTRKVQSLDLRTLTDLSLNETGGGSGEGTVLFGRSMPLESLYGGFAGWPGAEANGGPRFDLIGDARTVYELIRKTQRATV